MGEAWNRGGQRYSDRPQGDPYAVAQRVAKELGLNP
jgi:hypothetical protein